MELVIWLIKIRILNEGRKKLMIVFGIMLTGHYFLELNGYVLTVFCHPILFYYSADLLCYIFFSKHLYDGDVIDCVILFIMLMHTYPLTLLFFKALVILHAA